MVKRNAVYSAVINACKGYDYVIKDSKSTNTIYVKVKYGNADVCLRFSDHKGITNGMKWFDYSNPKAKYPDMIRYIENKLKAVKHISFQKSFALIA